MLGKVCGTEFIFYSLDNEKIRRDVASRADYHKNAFHYYAYRPLVDRIP